MNITDKIYWENNSRVKNSRLVNPSRIIEKNSTANFPAGAITIRLRNLNSKDINGTAYFYGDAETHQDYNGNPYQVASNKLMVSFFNTKDDIIFNGVVDKKSYSMQDLTDAVNYCKDIISKL